jgi:hypothetical protein
MTSPQVTEDAVDALATTIVTDAPPASDLTAMAVETSEAEAAIEQSTTVQVSELNTDDAKTDAEIVHLANDASEPEKEAPVKVEERPFGGEPAVPEIPHMSSMDGFAPATDMDQLDAMAYSQPEDFSMGMGGLPIADATGLQALMAMNGAMGQQPYIADDTPYAQAVDETRISAYAKLEFEDGEFYMNTYSVILGRDLAAARAAMRRDAEEQKRRIEEFKDAREPKTPIRIKREESRYSKSVISESGGILREGDDSDNDGRTKKRKSRKAISKKSVSTGSNSRRNSLAQAPGFTEYQPQSQVRRHAPDDDGAAPVDPASLRPSPYDCPVVGIHPPAATAAAGYKAISRQHVKIAYNSKKHLFEAEIIGRNGAFVDEEFYYHTDVIPLKSGSTLQIGGVVVRFVLPDVAIGETGAENQPEDNDEAEQLKMRVGDRYSEGGKEMSFDFEDAPREGVHLEDTSEEEDEGQEEVGEEEEEEEEEEEGEEEAEEEEQEEDGDGDIEEIEYDEMPEGFEDVASFQGDDNMDTIPSLMMPQKKRGPGRPPKNGIMSKREQQLAKREALAKAKNLNLDPSITGKNKVGRPRKHPLPEDQPIKTEKRKYTKRKPKDPESPTLTKLEGDIEGEGEGSPKTDAAKERKEKKALKPPRSPSPQFNEADLTPEQLAKPQANYVTLIHEALSNSPTGQMSLPQIYRAIQRRYPFFVLKCNTNGWQSSVRHNLSQHHAFRKVERDGKGWMWAIVDGVSIEKEKKRRVTPPPQMGPGHMHHQPIYRAGGPPHMMPGYPGMMGPPPPGSYIPGMPPPGFPGPHHFQPPNGYHMPPGAHPPNGQHIPSGPPLIPPVGPQGGTYSSPYAPKPTPPPPVQAAPPTHQMPSGPPPAPMQGHPMPSAPPPGPPRAPPGPPLLSDQVSRAIDAFAKALTGGLKGKTSNAEAIVASAVNRVKGVTTQSAVPGDPHEETILNALRDMVAKITGKPPPALPQNPARAPQQQAVSVQKSLQPQSSQQAAGVPMSTAGSGNAAAPATSNTHTPRPAGPMIMRPNFGGQSQNRTVGPAVPRPPMMTPGLNRANSASSASAASPRRPSVPTVSASPVPATVASPVPASVASPALAPIASPAATASPNLIPFQTDHTLAAVPAVTPAATATPAAAETQTSTPTPIAAAPESPQKVAAESPQIAPVDSPHKAVPTSPQTGMKRPLEDAEQNNDFKRLSSSGPPPLRT